MRILPPCQWFDRWLSWLRGTTTFFISAGVCPITGRLRNLMYNFIISIDFSEPRYLYKWCPPALTSPHLISSHLDSTCWFWNLDLYAILISRTILSITCYLVLMICLAYTQSLLKTHACLLMFLYDLRGMSIHDRLKDLIQQQGGSWKQRYGRRTAFWQLRDPICQD